MNNIIPFQFKLEKKDRNKLNGHNSFVIWFTGLSGSGKSTLANALNKKLFEKNIKTYILDGDNIRQGLNKDLTFNAKDRKENLRRTAQVAKLFMDAGLIVLAAFITPYRESRAQIKEILGADSIIEIHVNTSIEECERRDVKGLYRKARLGEIRNFTGITAPYEEPEKPDIRIDTAVESIDLSVTRILNLIQQKIKMSNNNE
jgi:adenylylsulfate kinase